MKNEKAMKEEMMTLVDSEIEYLLERTDLTEEGKLCWLAYQVFNIFDNGFSDMPTLGVRSAENTDGYESGKVVSGFSNQWFDLYNKKAKEEGRELSAW